MDPNTAATNFLNEQAGRSPYRLDELSAAVTRMQSGRLSEDNPIDRYVHEALASNAPLFAAVMGISIADGDGGKSARKGGIAKEAVFDTANLQSKIEGYLLNSSHPQNQTKAIWFEKALGFNQNNWTQLADQIKFDESKAIVTKTTQYGATFEQEIPIVGVNGKIIDVTFVFMKDNMGTVRLITGIPSSR